MIVVKRSVEMAEYMKINTIKINIKRSSNKTIFISDTSFNIIRDYLKSSI